MRPEADDAERLTVEAFAQRQRAFDPRAGAHEGLALDDAAHACQDQRERHVGDVLGQHVRRIGDPDAPRPRPVEVDGVEANAETGDDLELGTGVDETGAGAQDAIRRDGADQRADLAQEPRAIFGEPQFVDEIVAFEERHLPPGVGADHEYVWL